MVRASLVGAILANLLLALGVAFLLGGLRHHTQTYNATPHARVQLDDADRRDQPDRAERLQPLLRARGDHAGGALLNLGVAVVLLAAYVLYLVFMLKTHPDLFAGEAGGEEHGTTARAGAARARSAACSARRSSPRG